MNILWSDLSTFLFSPVFSVGVDARAKTFYPPNTNLHQVTLLTRLCIRSIRTINWSKRRIGNDLFWRTNNPAPAMMILEIIFDRCINGKDAQRQTMLVYQWDRSIMYRWWDKSVCWFLCNLVKEASHMLQLHC